MITMDDTTIKPAVLMKLKNIDNLIRMVIFWTRERTATILHFKQDKRHIIGTFTALPGYYNLEGLPLFLYVVQNEGPKGPFIKYLADPSEEWDYANGTFDRKFAYIPIITLEECPVFLKNI